MRSPVTAPRAHQLEREAVHLVEHHRVFHPQRGELVDVEEAPVVDLLRRDAPVGEPVRLHVEQPVERDRSCAAGRRRRSGGATLSSISAATPALALVERRQPPLDDFLLARADRDRLGLAIAARRQVPASRSGCSAARRRRRPAWPSSQRSSRALEDHAEGVGRDRQRLVVVVDDRTRRRDRRAAAPAARGPRRTGRRGSGSGSCRRARPSPDATRCRRSARSASSARSRARRATTGSPTSRSPCGSARGPSRGPCRARAAPRSRPSSPRRFRSPGLSRVGSATS